MVTETVSPLISSPQPATVNKQPLEQQRLEGDVVSDDVVVYVSGSLVAQLSARGGIASFHHLVTNAGGPPEETVLYQMTPLTFAPPKQSLLGRVLDALEDGTIQFTDEEYLESLRGIADRRAVSTHEGVEDWARRIGDEAADAGD